MLLEPNDKRKRAAKIGRVLFLVSAVVLPVNFVRSLWGMATYGAGLGFLLYVEAFAAVVSFFGALVALRWLRFMGPLSRGDAAFLDVEGLTTGLTVLLIEPKRPELPWHAVQIPRRFWDIAALWFPTNGTGETAAEAVGNLLVKMRVSPQRRE